MEEHKVYAGSYNDGLEKFFGDHPYLPVVQDRRVFKCDDHITIGGHGVISADQPIFVVRMPVVDGRDKVFTYCSEKCHELGARQRTEPASEAA